MSDRPVGAWEIAVSREIADVTRVVVGLPQGVLRLAEEIFRRSAAKANLKSIALLIALRLELPLLSQIWIWSRNVVRRSWRVHIHGAE